jgi:hypothetical protein
VVKPTWKREWEGSDLWGFDVIDFRIEFGKRVSHWRLYINRNEVLDNVETNKGTIRVCN